MQSTMQRGSLCVPLLLRHVQQVTGRSRVFTPEDPAGTAFRTLARRAGNLAGALASLGLAGGTVVGTLCASTREHLEAYLGVPGSGRVLHTINVRLHDEQIAYVIRHAGDQALIVDADQLARVLRILPGCPAVRALVVVGAPSPEPAGDCGLPVHGYEQLLSSAPAIDEWPDLDEHEAAIVCYTSGTTGMPKGVAYSHRSLWLQATSLCTANSLAIGATTRMLPAVPLYHVNGWGLPFAGLMAGAEIVLPGHSLHAADLLDLIERHQPDLAAGVPTVWSDVLQELRARGRSGLGALETISCGGAQVPNTLARAYADIGVEMVQAWGMTETSSMSTIARAPPWAGTDAERAHYLGTQGRVVCGLEIRVAEAGGETPADDDGAVGEIRIRGPWVTAGYLGGEGRDEFAGDWLRTGDLGSVDADGYLSLCDRVKDAIKSGGEWIPSLGLEQAIREHPAVGEVAVVAVDDPRWQERPAAVVVLKPGRSANAGELGAWLQTRVARWWVPSVWTVATELPRTSVGKIDKKRIRQMIKDGGFTAL